jgi:hypothetical protein
VYSKVSKRSGDGEDAVWVNENTGEELKGEEVTGYETNDPLARGVVRSVERVGEGRSEVRGGRGDQDTFFGGHTVAGFPPVTHYLCPSRVLRLFASGNRQTREESQPGRARIVSVQSEKKKKSGVRSNEAFHLQ